MCVRPIAIKNKGKVYTVPCGHCLECRRQFQTEWIFRLSQEVKQIACPCFVTLTYNDVHLPLGDTDKGIQSVVLKSDVQKFLKRLRKNGGSLMEHMRYFAVGEYGAKKNRAHYHLVIMAPNIVQAAQLHRLVDKSWRDAAGDPIGFVKVDYCTNKHIHYITKYMNKLDAREHLIKPFRLFSRGLGLGYLTAAVIKHYLTSFDYSAVNGNCRIRLPRYYRRKLDEISQSIVGFKEAGLDYSSMSNLLHGLQPKENSRYWFFEQFRERLQRLSDYADNAFKDGFCYSLPSVNSLFQSWFENEDFLVDVWRESERKLEDCKIKNGLKGFQVISTDEFLFFDEFY